MAEKLTIMRLKVDLQCEKCYKKVKKVLCKFPQIRDQVFDEKKNIVTIKVVCCSPEKIRDMLCCKGCGAIKSIEIVDAEPPRQETPKQATPPVVQILIGTCCVPCSKERPCGPCFEGHGRTCCIPCSEERPDRPCFEGYRRTCCGPCSEGWPDRPCFERYRKTCCVACFEGYGRPPPCYERYVYVRPVYDICGGGRPCYVSCYD